jgi:FkbM family methyltransferase
MRYLSVAECLQYKDELMSFTAPSSLGHWAARWETVSSSLAAYSSDRESRIVLPDVEGKAWLTVMANQWSNGLVVRTTGRDTVHNTYSDTHSIRRILLKDFREASNIEIGVGCIAGSQALSSELWLLQLEFEICPTWASATLTASNRLGITSGRHGTFLTLTHDVGVSKTIRDYGQWGEEQISLMREHIKYGDNAIDIGANIGHHSVLLSKIVGAPGSVTCFEPQPFIYRVLNANLALNNCDNVRAHCVALGNTNGTAMMAPSDYEADDWNVGGLGISPKANLDGDKAYGIEVPVRRLDDLVNHKVDFIKCDAQGFDFSALKGAERILHAYKPIILFEVAPIALALHDVNYKELYQYVIDFGYDLREAGCPAHMAREWDGIPAEWDVLALPLR